MADLDLGAMGGWTAHDARHLYTYRVASYTYKGGLLCVPGGSKVVASTTSRRTTTSPSSVSSCKAQISHHAKLMERYLACMPLSVTVRVRLSARRTCPSTSWVVRREPGSQLQHYSLTTLLGRCNVDTSLLNMYGEVPGRHHSAKWPERANRYTIDTWYRQ